MYLNKKTKIIATVGPSTESSSSLIDLYNVWVNVVRFNFSHADYTTSKIISDRIHELNKLWNTNLSLLLDTKWPEIRTWDLENKISYNKWDIFKIYFWNCKVDWVNSLYCDYENLNDLKIWDIIKIDSWLFDVVVVDVCNDYLLVEALNDALIWSRRHINLPWLKLKLPWVTNKDKEDILFWIKNNFDFIALSFVRNKSNIVELRNFLNENNASHIKIISKIENQEAIENLDEIIEYSDWVMVARWDLWIEVPIQMLPIYQKQIVQKCREMWKFVIVATHLLETMIDSPFPTRAEVWDIYNSVLQKADALMLSGETTIWKYPIESVKIMSQVILQAEENIFYDHHEFSDISLSKRDIEKKQMIKSSLYMSEWLWIKAVIILTKSWKLARLASSYKPNSDIYAFTMNKSTYKYMNLLFWIKPFVLDFDWSKLESLELAINYLYKNWFLSLDDNVIWIADIHKNWNEIPIMEIIYVKDIVSK